MNSFLLFLTACIWGSAFVAQSVGMDFVEPFTFTFARSIIGGLVLIPCIPFLRRLRHEKRTGILISSRIHSDFHKEYGSKNNTQEQFNEFLQLKYNTCLGKI